MDWADWEEADTRMEQEGEFLKLLPQNALISISFSLAQEGNT